MMESREADRRSRIGRAPEQLCSCSIPREWKPTNTTTGLNQLYLFAQVNSCPSQDPGNLAIIQPGSVILHADGVLFFVKLNLADAIDFPGIVERAHFFFAWRHAVFENHVKKGHQVSSKSSISRAVVPPA